MHVVAEKERKEKKKAKRSHAEASEPAEAEAASNGSADVHEEVAVTKKVKKAKSVTSEAVRGWMTDCLGNTLSEHVLLTGN